MKNREVAFGTKERSTPCGATRRRIEDRLSKA
jgi:hypothetical protein